MTESIGRPKQTEVTPGNAFQLGLPFVLANQSLFNFWDIHSGNYFIEMEGTAPRSRSPRPDRALGRPYTRTQLRRSSFSWRARSPSPLMARSWT
jgi:hypothetical protein